MKKHLPSINLHFPQDTPPPIHIPPALERSLGEPVWVHAENDYVFCWWIKGRHDQCCQWDVEGMGVGCTATKIVPLQIKNAPCAKVFHCFFSDPCIWEQA
jgi:hypothetical protein